MLGEITVRLLTQTGRAPFESTIRANDASPGLRAFPADVRHEIGMELMRVQASLMLTNFKPMSTVKRYRSIGGWIMAKATRSTGNVFEDLGFDKAEAEVMKLRAEIMIRIEQHLREQKWSQREAAARLHITQPRVSRLMKGACEDFSLDMLVTIAHRAGLKPTLRVAS